MVIVILIEFVFATLSNSTITRVKNLTWHKIFILWQRIIYLHKITSELHDRFLDAPKVAKIRVLAFNVRALIDIHTLPPYSSTWRGITIGSKHFEEDNAIHLYCLCHLYLCLKNIFVGFWVVLLLRSIYILFVWLVFLSLMIKKLSPLWVSICVVM